MLNVSARVRCQKVRDVGGLLRKYESALDTSDILKIGEVSGKITTKIICCKIAAVTLPTGTKSVRTLGARERGREAEREEEREGGRSR